MKRTWSLWVIVVVMGLSAGTLVAEPATMEAPAAPAAPAKKAKAATTKKAPATKKAAATKPLSNLPWPPPLRNAHDGTATITGDAFLRVPDEVLAIAKDPKAVPFEVAKTPPVVELAFHSPLSEGAVNARLWSEWGDICVASDGKVYCAIGDHGDDAGGKSHCYIFQWDPQSKTLKRIVDMNQVAQRTRGDEPSWSKVHARIDEGADGKIYFSCTLNDGNAASNTEKFKWSESLPGGQLYQFDPQTGKTAIFASLPPARCTATSRLDRERNIWWCNLEAGPKGANNALWAIDLTTKKVVFQAPDGSVGFNRNFALARNGSVYFNGQPVASATPTPPPPTTAEKEATKGQRRPTQAPQDTPIWKFDIKTHALAPTKSLFPHSPGMRSSSAESKDGWIYGTTQGTSQLFRYAPGLDKLEMLGPEFLVGNYTTVTVLSPDERFLYYLPGAHGGAFSIGTPVVQYEIATGKRKVLAFLRDAFQEQAGYVPGGTYGVKLSADGSTLYANLNGHAADALRPEHMKPIGFGLTSFVAIHIPSSER